MVGCVGVRPFARFCSPSAASVLAGAASSPRRMGATDSILLSTSNQTPLGENHQNASLMICSSVAVGGGLLDLGTKQIVNFAKPADRLCSGRATGQTTRGTRAHSLHNVNSCYAASFDWWEESDNKKRPVHIQ